MSVQAGLYGGMAALQLAGGYFASQNIKATADLNRDISNMNAEFAELDAYDSKVEGFSNEARYQHVIDNTLADQRTIMGAEGVDVNYGSAASIAKETSFTGQLNLMQIEKEAQQQALGYTRQARDVRLGASLNYSSERARASQAMFSGVIGGVDSGLTGYQRSK